MLPKSRDVIRTTRRFFEPKPSGLLCIGAGVVVGYAICSLGNYGLSSTFCCSRTAGISGYNHTVSQTKKAEISANQLPPVHSLDEPSSPAVNDTSQDGPLPRAFEAALQTYPVVPPAEVNIVLVVSYYRSGSTFVGELLSSGAMTFFHFEPLMMFTVSGRLSPSRERYAFDLLDKLTLCRMENVPLYMLFLEQRPEYLHHNRFLADLCKGGEYCFSPRHVGALCARAKSQVYKFTRISVSQVRSWIKRLPNTKGRIRLLHLVRDPRAIYASRRGLRWCTQNKNCDSAEALCDQLRSDLDAFEELEREIGSTRAQRLRFEDLAADPVNETLRLYRKLGLVYGTSVSEYLNSHTKATAKDMKDAHSTRRNTTTVAESWKGKLSIKTIASIQKVCNDTLQRLGYKFVQ